MSEAYTNCILRVVVGQICSNMGFTSIGELALDTLVDVLKQQLLTSTVRIKQQCDYHRRTEPLLDDASIAMNLSGSNLKQLLEYMTSVLPLPSVLNVPEYPVQHANPVKIHGNFTAKLDPDRPAYVYEYLPSMLPDKEHLERLAGTEEEKEKSEENTDKEKAATVENRKTRSTARTITGDDSFELPDFDAMDAISAGLVRIVNPPSPPPPKISVLTQQPPIPPTKIVLSFPMFASSTARVTEKKITEEKSDVIPLPSTSAPTVVARPIVTPKPVKKPFTPKDGSRPRGRPPKKKPTIKPGVKKFSSNLLNMVLPPPVPSSGTKETKPTCETSSNKDNTNDVVDLTGNSPVHYEPGALLQEIKEKQMAKDAAKLGGRSDDSSEKVPFDSLREKLKLNRQTFSKEVMKEKIKKRALERQKQHDIIQEIVQKQPAIAAKTEEKPAETIPILTLKLSPQKGFEKSSRTDEDDQQKEKKKSKTAKKSDKVEPATLTPTARAASKVKKALVTKHAPLKVKLKLKGLNTPPEVKEKKKKKRKHSETIQEEKSDKRAKSPMPVLQAEGKEKSGEPPPRKVPKLVLKLPTAPQEEEKQILEEKPMKLPPLKLKMAAVKVPSPSPPPRTPSPRSMTPTSPIRIHLEASPRPETPKPVTPPPPVVTPISIKITPMQLPVTTAKKPTPASKKKAKKPAAAKKRTPTSSAAAAASPPPEDEKEWFCPVCAVKYDENADMIGCDRCDEWFHWACVGINSPPPDDEKWFCKGCESAQRILPQKKKYAPRGRKKKT